MERSRTATSELIFRLADPNRRAALAAALAGTGKPAGILACEVSGDDVIIRVDSHTTPLELVRHLAEIEIARFDRPGSAAPDGSDASLARSVAAAIGDPALDERRILEVLVPELDRLGAP